MSRRLYIIGTGGFAKEVAQLATAINAAANRWHAIEYLCEKPEDVGTHMPFGHIAGTDELLHQLGEDADYVIGIGDPKLRQRIAERLRHVSYLTAPNLIHPTAGLDQAVVQLGFGNIVTRGVIFTCDIIIGNYNVFNLNSTVGHDARIGSHCVVNPGCNISGGVSLGDACLLGTGCQVLEGLAICSDATLGAGSLIAKPVTEPGIYVGVPAKLLIR